MTLDHSPPPPPPIITISTVAQRSARYIFKWAPTLYMNIRNKLMSWNFGNFCILYFCGLLSFLRPPSPLRFSGPLCFFGPPLHFSASSLCFSIPLLIFLLHNPRSFKLFYRQNHCTVELGGIEVPTYRNHVKSMQNPNMNSYNNKNQNNTNNNNY